MFRVSQTASLVKLFANRCAISTVQPTYFHTSNSQFAKLNDSKRALPTGYRPPTPYSLLLKEVYQPGMSIAEAGKLTGSKWKSLSSSEIEEFNEKAKQIGIKRSQDFEKLSKQEQTELYEQQEEARKKRRLRAHRDALHKYYEHTNRPTKPPGSYALYVKDEMSKVGKVHDREKLNSLFAEAARKWNSMSENEKSRYYDEAQKLRDVHVKSLEEWKTKENLEAKKLFIANAKKTSTRRRRTIAASDANQKTGRKVGRPSGSRKTSK
ncbi:HMG box domain-containing protein [Aphelenchoides besseyi]|nr:HMG box domain-containing protein [Aphelenchoides besseyi]